MELALQSPSVLESSRVSAKAVADWRSKTASRPYSRRATAPVFEFTVRPAKTLRQLMKIRSNATYSHWIRDVSKSRPRICDTQSRASLAIPGYSTAISPFRRSSSLNCWVPRQLRHSSHARIQGQTAPAFPHTNFRSDTAGVCIPREQLWLASEESLVGGSCHGRLLRQVPLPWTLLSVPIQRTETPPRHAARANDTHSTLIPEVGIRYASDLVDRERATRGRNEIQPSSRTALTAGADRRSRTRRSRALRIRSCSSEHCGTGSRRGLLV